MTAEAKTAQTVGGDWDLRGISLDSVFAASELSDTAIDAAIRTSAKFDPAFPGWLLYRRVASGSNLFDRPLEAWAIGCARALSRSTRNNGRSYIWPSVRGRAGWVAQAGRDALDYAIFGRFPESLESRGARYGVDPETYKKIRDPVANGMWIGMDTFRAMLFHEFWQVRREERSGEPKAAVK